MFLPIVARNLFPRYGSIYTRFLPDFVRVTIIGETFFFLYIPSFPMNFSWWPIREPVYFQLRIHDRCARTSCCIHIRPFMTYRVLGSTTFTKSNLFSSLHVFPFFISPFIPAKGYGTRTRHPLNEMIERFLLGLLASMEITNRRNFYSFVFVFLEAEILIFTDRVMAAGIFFLFIPSEQ